MSFGFSLSDFVAVATLAKSLYNDIFMLARGAPDDLKALMAEIAIFIRSVDILNDEDKNPQSALVRAGARRVCTVNDIMAQVDINLKEFQTYSIKRQLINQKSADPSRFCVKKGADILLPDSEGMLPLYHAIWSEDEQFLEMVLDLGGLADNDPIHEYVRVERFEVAAVDGGKEMVPGGVEPRVYQVLVSGGAVRGI
ncbi:MAG: hypothetical protein M1827_004907 [Pycnora praestabilis]|nr:MAG: hypothetical protein M1827_004907 [Pycnora praestabilis]